MWAAPQGTKSCSGAWCCTSPHACDREEGREQDSKAPQKQGLGLLQELLRYFLCDFELTAKPQFSPWSWRNPLGPCLFPPLPHSGGGCCDLVR